MHYIFGFFFKIGVRQNRFYNCILTLQQKMKNIIGLRKEWEAIENDRLLDTIKNAEY